MKLSKLYCSDSEKFEPIEFVEGLNVVLGEIRLPQNREKDTHNLGKTTLAGLIDFALLGRRQNDFFLFKHEHIFKDFVFFLEVEIEHKSFITIRRAVQNASKISFMRHDLGQLDFSDAEDWDHEDVPLERARELLDGMLDLEALSPWTFRKMMGYLLRTQGDYQDVFRLKAWRGSDAQWKPFLAHILGFDSDLIVQHYKIAESLESRRALARTLKVEIGDDFDDLGRIEGILQLKDKEVSKKKELLDAFDFRKEDTEKTTELVAAVEARIATLNTRRYVLKQNLARIKTAMAQDHIVFDPEQAANLFREAGVFFEGQIKRDFEQLIEFNRAISAERRIYLEEERQELQNELTEVNQTLNKLGKKRSEDLKFLSATDSIAKYKSVSEEMIVLLADIESLQRRRKSFFRLQELRAEIRSHEESLRRMQEKIEADVEQQNSDSGSFFARIRLNFSEVVEEVIDRKALLSLSPNQLGHLNFKAEILDHSGNSTSANHGHSYRKLLCIAFDLALLGAHIGHKFPRFIFMDGVFESLDVRKKEKLLRVIRSYAELGIQPIITVIDTDIAQMSNSAFTEDEIILTLHDESDDGLLFKMHY